VRSVWRRTWTSRSLASHVARRWHALAGGPGDRLVRVAGSVVVPLDPGAQRAADRSGIAGAGRRRVRGVRHTGRMGMGARALRRSLAHGRIRTGVRPGRRRARKSWGAHRRATVALLRDGGRGTGGGGVANGGPAAGIGLGVGGVWVGGTRAVLVW